MRNVRFILTRVHRWTGLALALFLIVVAATGAILPFQTELQRLIAPERFVEAPFPYARPLDWLKLRQVAEERSGGIVTTVPLRIIDDAAIAYSVAPRPGHAHLGFDEILIDPYTGKEIARDLSGDLRDGRAQIVPFLFLVHQNLALGDWGMWLLGITALAWTVDCFVGFYLTLPASRKEWWRRWMPAWTIKRPVKSRFRFHFDLHRASGLWLWPLLFVFAWSGTAFNLPQVYFPVMHALIGLNPEQDIARTKPDRAPALTWERGLRAARRQADETLAARGVSIEWERELRYYRSSNSYALALRTNRDRSDDFANSWVTIDADDGRLLSVQLPTGERVGNTIDYWLGLLHEAGIFGLGYRILVSLCGVGIIALSSTGILIWALKRKARSTPKERVNTWERKTRL